MRASVSWTSPVASNGTGTAPSKSEPRPTWSTPATSTAYRIERAIAADVVAAAGRRPEPDARPRRRWRRSRGAWASLRLRALSDDPAHARVRRDDRARGHRQDVVDRGGRRVRHVQEHPRAPPSDGSSRARRSVSPPLSTPCAEPPNALSKKWLGDIIRKPASATTSTFAGSPSSAWAPSMARRPAVIPGRARRAVSYAARSCLDRMIVRRPSERAAIASARAARWSARGRSRRHVADGQPSASASSTTSSLRSSLRSMLRWRGDLVEAASTWSATLPAMSRGTST